MALPHCINWGCGDCWVCEMPFLILNGSQLFWGCFLVFQTPPLWTGCLHLSYHKACFNYCIPRLLFFYLIVFHLTCQLHFLLLSLLSLRSHIQIQSTPRRVKAPLGESAMSGIPSWEKIKHLTHVLRLSKVLNHREWAPKSRFMHLG